MPRSEGKAIKADFDASLPHGEFRDNGGDPGDWLTLGPGFLQPLKEAWWVGAGLSAPTQEGLTRMGLWHHSACRWGLPAATPSSIYVNFGTWLLCSSAPGPLSLSQPLFPCLLKEELISGLV